MELTRLAGLLHEAVDTVRGQGALETVRDAVGDSELSGEPVSHAVARALAVVHLGGTEEVERFISAGWVSGVLREQVSDMYAYYNRSTEPTDVTRELDALLTYVDARLTPEWFATPPLVDGVDPEWAQLWPVEYAGDIEDAFGALEAEVHLYGV